MNLPPSISQPNIPYAPPPLTCVAGVIRLSAEGCLPAVVSCVNDGTLPHISPTTLMYCWDYGLTVNGRLHLQKGCKHWWNCVLRVTDLTGVGKSTIRPGRHNVSSSENIIVWYVKGPMPVPARSRVYVCGRAFTGIVGSNPTEGIDVCFLWAFALPGVVCV
jgi:hypothetical protein